MKHKIYDSYIAMLRHSGIDPYLIRAIREEFIYHDRSLLDTEWLKSLPKNYDPSFLSYVDDKDIGESMINDENLVINEDLLDRPKSFAISDLLSFMYVVSIIALVLFGIRFFNQTFL